MIVSRLKWKRVKDGREYVGFDVLVNPDEQLQLSDRVVIVWLPKAGISHPVYFVDCDAGIGEIRHMYRVEHRATVQTLVLNRDLPSWIATATWVHEDDHESETAVGPFYREQAAMERLRIDEKQPGYMGGSTIYLNKP